MAEISSYIAHEQYAHGLSNYELFIRQYHVPPSQSGNIASKAAFQNVVPIAPAVDQLMGSRQRKTWARFSIPPSYFSQRFFSPYFAPSIGDAQAEVRRIKGFLQRAFGANPTTFETPEKRKMYEEGQLIIKLLEDGIAKPNEIIRLVQLKRLEFIAA